MPIDPVALPIEVKEQFLDLSASLEPEVLTCDGEIPPAEAERRRKKILTQWRKLERQYDVTFTYTSDPLGLFFDEVQAWRRAEEDRRLAEWEAICGTDPRVVSRVTGVWVRYGQPIGATGSTYTAYHITKRPAHSFAGIPMEADKDFCLRSEILRDMGLRDDLIGRFETLHDAVEAGEEFLAQISAADVVNHRPGRESADSFWVKEVLNKLPDDHRSRLQAELAAMAAPAPHP